MTLEWIDGDMPYSTRFGDHFYCRGDGRAECGHVFLAGNGLPERWAAGGTFNIAELGFGTGLNFCETLRRWRSLHPLAQASDAAAMPQLVFTSFELYPMDRDSIDRSLRRWPEIDAERALLLAHWPEAPRGEVVLDIAADVRLNLVVGDASATLTARQTRFDAWYLDGFAPSRNPALWSEALMAAVYDHTVDGGSFATYAAAGFVRRNLTAAGFTVERRPGFGGKREMLAGVRATAPKA